MFCKDNYAESNNENCFETRWCITKILGFEKIDVFFFGNFDSALLVKKKVLKVESEIYSYLN